MNLIFDIDGTIWDTTEVVATAWNDAIYETGMGAEYGRCITADMLKKEFGRPMDVIVNDLFPNMPHARRPEFMNMCKIMEQEQIRANQKDLTYPKISETLNSLSMKHKLYIVSNCQEGYIPLVLEKIGLSDIISDSECFGITGLSKSENIRLIMSRNNLPDAETFYIGDTLGDYCSTSEAGITFIYAAYGFGAMDKNYNGLSIASPNDLLSIFAG